MLEQVSLLVLHTICFIIYVFYTTKSFLFFHLFRGIVRNKLLHLFHTSLIVHVLVFIGNCISDFFLGSLTESERVFYNNKVYTMFSDLFMVVSFFPSDFKMVNLIYFVFLFNFNSISWVYAIKARNSVNRCMLLKGCLGLVFSFFFFYFCCVALSKQFSIVVLFGLEYVLVALKYLKIVSIIAFDMTKLKIHRTLALFFISIAYFVLESCVLLGFISYVTINKKFPINLARLLLVSLSKLRKKTQLLFGYLNICKCLDTLPDVNADYTCVICTETIITGKLLPCNHTFHTECLKMWCEHESNCPVCRADLNINRERQLTTEDEIIYGIPIEG